METLNADLVSSSLQQMQNTSTISFSGTKKRPLQQQAKIRQQFRKPALKSPLPVSLRKKS